MIDSPAETSCGFLSGVNRRQLVWQMENADRCGASRHALTIMSAPVTQIL